MSAGDKLLGVVLGLFAFAIYVLFASGALAHGRYEVACCSDKDCFAVDDKIVTESSAGFLLNDTGEFVERTSTKVRKPMDESYHLCRNPAGALLCIYPKFQGN